MRLRFLMALLLWGLASGASAQVRGGTLELYVFGPDGLGASGVSSSADGKKLVTDEEGYVGVTLSPGIYDLSLVREGVILGTVSVRIRQGEVTESVVNLRSAPTAATETAPPSPASEKLPTTGPAANGTRVTLIGSVLHLETRKPVDGATVLARGVDSEARTDAQGQFRLEVPQGTITLSVIHPQFATQTLNDLAVAASPAPVVVELTPSALQLEAVSVFSASEVLVQGGISALVEEAKNSSVVLNLIGAEQIGRTGDSDAAQALGRVTGLTVVDGKSVYVRGMGDRYASSLLNGARLPSPETDKRVVPLDLFPTAILESLAIQKTYGADLYGDFGGGAVSLRTVGVPDDRFKRRLRGSLSFSLGFDPTTLGQAKTLGTGGTLDVLGLDDGTRALPSDPTSPSAFKNNWGDQEVLFLPDPAITFTLRDQYDLAEDRRFGWSLASLYKHRLSEDTQTNLSYGSLDGSLVTQNMVLTTVGRDVDSGLLLNAEYDDPAWLKAEATTFGTRLTAQKRTLAQGQDKELPEAKLFETSWVEQSLLNQRLSAKVKFPGGWQGWSQYSLSWARRSEPDHQYVGYGRESSDEEYTTNERVGRPYRLYTQVEDLIHDLTAKVTVPLAEAGWGDHSFELGAQWIRQDRSTETRRFSFKINQDSSSPPDEIFAPGNIGQDNTSPVRLTESTLSTDQYTAGHTVTAGFAVLDLQLFEVVRASLGLRAEWSRQAVFTYDLFTGTGSEALLEDLDWLPSANFTVPLGDQWQLRFGGSRTVNRPDLRELSKAPKDGLPGQGQFVGNPDLKRAVIWAADLRLEQYLGPSESWSVGAFAKSFTDAIEVFQEAGAGSIKTPVNVPKATNWGAELEWSLTLAGIADLLAGLPNAPALTAGDFWAQRQWRGLVGNALRDLTFTGNLALIASSIDYLDRPPGVTTSSSRPLQGQSPYVLNGSLTYKNSTSWSPKVKSDTTATASYNLFGPRIVSLGVNGYPDAYEQPFHQVDITVKHRLDEAWSLDAKVKNLLDLPAVVKAGDLLLEERAKGRGLSLGVKYEF